MSLRLVTLGIALNEVERNVREVGGNNSGPEIRKYLAATDPPINVAAPWCAAFCCWASDVAAKHLRAPNPLDAVKLEALVLSYYEWAAERGLRVLNPKVQRGDLVLYDFNAGGNDWDHMGIVLSPPDANGAFSAAEGNTGSQSQRDGDGVYVRSRTTKSGYPTAFIHWSD